VHKPALDPEKLLIIVIIVQIAREKARSRLKRLIHG
jgi:hypothetical protein